MKNKFALALLLTGAVVGVGRIPWSPGPVAEVAPEVVAPASTGCTASSYTRDPEHGYPVDAWKCLKGKEQQLALKERCESHLLYRDHSLECAGL